MSRNASVRSESLGELVDRLTRAGYTEDFRAEQGRLVATRLGRRYLPEDLVVDHEARFEGDADPDELAIVLALRSPRDGVRGTFCVPFGPEATEEDAEALRRLAHPRGRSNCAPGGS